jgi:hypothetical protein
MGSYIRVLALALAIVGCPASVTLADEGGISFWLPGQYGSFAAVAPAPGFSMPLVFYNYAGSAGRGVTLSRGHLLTAGLNGSQLAKQGRSEPRGDASHPAPERSRPDR